MWLTVAKELASRNGWQSMRNGVEVQSMLGPEVRGATCKQHEGVAVGPCGLGCGHVGAGHVACCNIPCHVRAVQDFMGPHVFTGPEFTAYFAHVDVAARTTREV